MFTQEEISAAKATRDAIIKQNVSEVKPIYMAGEICMWDEMRNKLPLDPAKLAEWLHDTYEVKAAKSGWRTQESCQVKFSDLPESNKNTMILVATELIKKLES